MTIRTALNDKFGTVRGLVRLTLSYGEVMLGRGHIAPPDDVAAIRRLVFVCHGNICRSAFADVLARKAGLETTSFGLSTSSGKGAHPPAIAAAHSLGHDLGSHRSLRMEDFIPLPGDLLLAMETRQLRKLAANPHLSRVPRTLLGLFTDPITPHLHDPYRLSEAYMHTCLRRIETAIPALVRAFPNARAS